LSLAIIDIGAILMIVAGNVIVVRCSNRFLEARIPPRVEENRRFNTVNVQVVHVEVTFLKETKQIHEK